VVGAIRLLLVGCALTLCTPCRPRADPTAQAQKDEAEEQVGAYSPSPRRPAPPPSAADAVEKAGWRGVPNAAAAAAGRAVKQQPHSAARPAATSTWLVQHNTEQCNKMLLL
jgi:hypothetical protein